jgi:DNA repair protein SbcD/Mre11
LKLLHTADLHLTEDNPERWAALDQLVEVARRENAAALLIAGDLFDHHVDADRLRPALAKVLGGEKFKTVILPGNHDHAAYSSGLYFGAAVSVIDNWQEPLQIDKALLWGLPYEKISGERLVERLRLMGSMMDKNDCNILLFHGELLDAYYSRSDMGDEGDQRYMPVNLTYFKTLPIRYVLAGHFHSRYAAYNLPNEGLFIYPGSPVAITRRETGRRVANLVAINEAPVEIALNTYHFEELNLTLDPFDPVDPLVLLEQKMRQIDAQAVIKLTIRGLFNGVALGKSEVELAEALRKIAGNRLAGDPVESFYDVRHVLEDDLFKEFKLRLEQSDCSPDIKTTVEGMVIEAFRVVKVCS